LQLKLAELPRKFEPMIRLYAPTKALFEKTWKLPNEEKVAVQ